LGHFKKADALFGALPFSLGNCDWFSDDTVFGRVTEHAMHDIALKVFKHLHSLDLEFHLNRKTGALGRDIERGTTGISFLLRFMVFNIVPTFLEIILVIVILSSRYSLWFGVIVFGAIACYIAWSVWATGSVFLRLTAGRLRLFPYL